VPYAANAEHKDRFAPKLEFILNTAPSSGNKRDNEKNDKNKEQHLGNRRGACCDPEKSKHSGNDRNDQKNDCPA
jgi:hypothetical protein